MMNRVVQGVLLAGASMAAFASTAAAQSAEGESAPQARETGAAGIDSAIVVTARRRAEVLLDVPQTINAVTTETLQDFNILNFKEVSELIPGLTLESNNQGFAATAQVRGVNFQVTAQGTPTVEMYLNEVPLEPNTIFQANFDVGQIEVLRGPQGTLRGRSSPSGAITISTRRPDLDELGGYFSSTLNDNDGINVQGALGLPLIEGVLGLRLSGVHDRNDAGGVRSTANPAKPREESTGFRATLRFEPTSTLSAVVMYQRMTRQIDYYGDAQFGNGASGLTNFANFTRPASTGSLTSVAGACATAIGNCVTTGGNLIVIARPGFNGPVLPEADARGKLRNTTDFMSQSINKSHIVTAQVDWSVAGQKLSYVGSYVDLSSRNLIDNDATNTVVGVQRRISRNSCCGEDRRSHELRLASEERIAGLFDYTVGAFYGKAFGTTFNENVNQFVLNGAFGSPLGASAPTGPGTLSPLTYDPRYTAGFTNISPRKEVEKGLFANLMLHLGERTELSAGGRQIRKRTVREVAPVGVSGIAALRNPNATAANPFAPCPTVLSGPTGLGNVINGTVVGQTYPGTCDVAVSPGNGAPAVANIIRPIPRTVRKAKPFVYNFSLSHKFTPDIMAYATYGTSWRQGPGPIVAAPACASGVTPGAPDPTYCSPFNILDDEKSKGVELGVKAALFDRRLTLSVAAYQQDFRNFFIRGLEAVPYLQGNCTDLTNTQLCTVTSGTFTYNSDARVKGVDVEANLRVSSELNVSALFSYARGKFSNSLIPCRDSNFDGTPEAGALPAAAGRTPAQAWVDAKGPYGPALCANAGSSTTAPPWNLSLRSEYVRDAFPGTQAFLRGLFNYYPRNTNKPNEISVDGANGLAVSRRAPRA